MTQDAGWRLLRVGRQLERLQFSAEILARHVASDAATRRKHIEWLLEAYDSMRVYRSRYAVAPRLGPTLDLLLRDAEHPGALAFQSQAVAKDLAALSAALAASSAASLVDSLSGNADDALEEAIPELSDEELLTLEDDTREAERARQLLAARLRALAASAGKLSDRLSMRHFSHIGFNSQALAI
jgi:uncharacterized alpha-E superfamily protein